MVAYDKLTGELKWKSAPLSGTPGYVSPTIVKIGGEDHLVMMMASVGRGRTARDGSVNGLDPRSGKVLWTYLGWQCAIPVPQPVDAGDGRMLITGGYGAGSAMFQVQKKADGSFESPSCSRTSISALTPSRRFCSRTTSTPTTRSTSAATGSWR